MKYVELIIVKKHKKISENVDTNFEGNLKNITKNITLVKYNYAMCNLICVTLENQTYYDNITKEKCAPSEIEYLLFHEYDNESINNIFSVKLAPIFMKQLDAWYYEEKYEDSLKEGSQNRSNYWYDLFKRSQFEWSKELLQFNYLPSKNIETLKYKPKI